MGLAPTGLLSFQEGENLDTDPQGGDHVMAEAETGGILLQTRLTRSSESAEKMLPRSEGAWPCRHFEFRFLTFRTGRR